MWIRVAAISEAGTRSSDQIVGAGGYNVEHGIDGFGRFGGVGWTGPIGNPVSEQWDSGTAGYTLLCTFCHSNAVQYIRMPYTLGLYVKLHCL